MRSRIATAAAVAAVALLVAVPLARAGSSDYSGQVEHDGSTFFGFDIAKAGGKTKIKHVIGALAYTCRGNDPGGIGIGFARGSLTVKGGKFHGTLPFDFDTTRGGASEGTYKISGKAPQNGLAKGTISGELRLNAPRGGGESCYTGVVDWNVTQNQRGR